MKRKTKIIIFCLLMAFVVLIGILHTLTPGHLILYHDSYRRLSYFPIAIGAILFGLWGGLSLAIASCMAFVPHLFLFFAQGPQAYYSELSEVIFYLAAGLIIGLISSRENRLRERYKNLSEQLAASYKRLHEQASRLVEAEKQLGQSQRLSMLGQVSASLAHEIKNPLAAIKGAAEILADEVEKDHPKYEFVEIMRSEVSRLNTSVEDVLAYCRGQQAPVKGREEIIQKVVARVVKLLETSLEEKSIKISMPVESDFPCFLIEEAAMTQVLINIILNAVDAVQKGGRIVIECDGIQKGCQISVSDDGPGIDEALREKVFHSFVTGKEGGTGLGLAISQKIVNYLGGQIHIEQSDLGGAKVCLVLPEKSNLINKSISND
ncbi:MAG: ATP-binding protein [Pseudomonadota bacterium]